MFGSLLIANRGEIACRIIKAAGKLGVRTIAVYSEADINAAHVRLADEAYLIGPAPASHSYLSSEKILDVARKSGAEAIHPGYGFLAENAEFAENCRASGVIFVGPSATAIRVMGVKDAAKALAETASVPVVSGYFGDDQRPEVLKKQAGNIGYPVLIKAVAGGGGKGMRRVDDAGEFLSALEAAMRESQNAFGESRVLLEKYIVSARHIEVQIFCDAQGHGVHLYERDCSLQRRHQKVIEEAPAPGMTDDLRSAMCSAALRIAKAVSYEGAGTVEFLVDASDELKPDAFYFMEMNTRLQVEHPVTEMITGIDCVEWQLRIAAGEPLPLAQEGISLTGHAVEARVYAEDPENHFLPSTGQLEHVRFPTENQFLRVETGIVQGDEVTIHYDPMIAKIASWGPSRGAAITRLNQALGAVQIAGLRHNVSFLARALFHSDFIAGYVNTHFLDSHIKDLVRLDKVRDQTFRILAALFVILTRRAGGDEENLSLNSDTLWGNVSGWRIYGPGTERIELDDGSHILVLYQRDGSFEISGQDWRILVSGELTADNQVEAKIDGVDHKAALWRNGKRLDVMWQGATHTFILRNPLAVGVSSSQGGNVVVAPMPGKITSLVVQKGDLVEQGTPLLVLEAMKMEHTLKAPCDGCVSDLNLSEGDQVSEGDILVRLEEADTA